MNLTEKTVKENEVYKGKLLHVFCDDIELPDGNPATREYIKHVGAVCVVPVTEDGKVVVEKQYRYPFRAVLTEIPAGKLDSKEEPHLEAAERELREETGAKAEKLIYMGGFIPTCAYSDEVIHMYLATGITFGERELDEDEFLDVELVPLDTLVKDIMDGKIQDGKTQTAILKAYMLLNNK